MSCVYHGRTKGATSKVFTDRSKAVLLLWFTISVRMSLPVCPGDFFIIISGKKLFFWRSACSVLIVVPLAFCL